MRIENLPPMAQARSARPIPPDTAKSGPAVAQIAPPTKVGSSPVIENTAPATLSGLLTIQENSRGPGAKPETKSPAQQIRSLENPPSGRDFGAAVSALASGREVVSPPKLEEPEPVVEAAPPETEGPPSIDVEPAPTLLEQGIADLEPEEEPPTDGSDQDPLAG